MFGFLLLAKISRVRNSVIGGADGRKVVSQLCICCHIYAFQLSCA